MITFARGRIPTNHHFARSQNQHTEKALVLGIEFWYFPAIAMARHPPTPAPEAAFRPALPRRQPWRFWSHAALFAATVLLVNGLFGERGLMDTIRAHRAAAAAARDLEQLKRDNAALRDRASRLRSDPATIESVAREELGLMRPGEILVTIKDVK
jgi:cell division protein FtsB